MGCGGRTTASVNAAAKYGGIVRPNDNPSAITKIDRIGEDRGIFIDKRARCVGNRPESAKITTDPDIAATIDSRSIEGGINESDSIA